MMLFAGQNTVYFGSANFSDSAFVPEQPYVELRDETIYFTDDPSVVQQLHDEVRRRVDRHDELRELRQCDRR